MGSAIDTIKRFKEQYRSTRDTFFIFKELLNDKDRPSEVVSTEETRVEPGSDDLPSDGIESDLATGGSQFVYEPSVTSDSDDDKEQESDDEKDEARSDEDVADLLSSLQLRNKDREMFDTLLSTGNKRASKLNQSKVEHFLSRLVGATMDRGTASSHHKMTIITEDTSTTRTFTRFRGDEKLSDRHTLANLRKLVDQWLRSKQD